MSKKTRRPRLRFPEFEDEWEKRKLKDVVDIYSGLKSKKKKDFNSSKSNSFYISYLDIFNNNSIEYKNISNKVHIKEEEKQNLVIKNDVLLTLSSENYEDLGVSTVYLSDEPVYLNSFSLGLRGKKINGVFLNYLMKSPQLRKSIILEGQGITRINLSQTRIGNINIKFPSLPEQEKIGSFFKTLDTLIENQRKYIEKIKDRKKGLLQDIFLKKIRMKDENGKEFEGEWEKVKLGDICEIKTGRLNANKAVENGKYPFFTCSKEVSSINNYAYNEDAILLAGNGDIGDLKRYNGKFNAYQRTYILTQRESFYFMDYVYYFMENDFKTYIYNLINSSAMTYIRKGDLTNFKIFLPSLPEQEAIGSFFKTIDKKIEREKELLNKYKMLKKALLQDVFI